MTPTPRRVFVATVLLATACARGPSAHPYADPERDCRSAATLFAPGRGPSPQMTPELWRVRACPARAGAILAQELRSSRRIADTAQLEARTWLTQYVHDANLLDAGVDVATDSMATPEARIAALRVMLWSKAPGHRFSLREMIEGPRCVPLRCTSTYTGHFFGAGPIAGDTISWPVFGKPMPARYVSLIDSVARVLEDAPSTPELVRRGAGSVRRFPPDAELNGR